MNDFENNNSPETKNQIPPTYTIPSFGENNPYQKPKKKGHSTTVVIVSCLLSAVMAVASFVLVENLPLTGTRSESEYSENKKDEYATENAADDSTANIIEQPKSNVNITVDENVSSIAEAVAIKCTHSVVGIRTTTLVSGFFGGSQEQSGNGSGVVYTADGYIITNYHVIKDAVETQNSKIDVFVGNDQSKSYPATVVGYNISCDLAIVKIKANGLTPIEFGVSDNLKVGQYVVTIGSPGGLEFMGSVTYGIISGLDRIVSTNSSLKLIQTDAAINPGNSGGALLNAEGKLIGINSSKIAAVDYEGMGFAIPVNTVKEICEKIMSRDSDSQAYFGVSINSTYTGEVLEYYGYPAGAVVSTVVEDSPAADVGIRRGDIITEFNGVEIKDYTLFIDTLNDCKAGDKVSVTIYRSGKYYTVDVKLASNTSN